MSKRVLKWNVPVDDRPHPTGAGKVLYVQCQYGPDSVQVWTEESELTAGAERQVQVFGTGHQVPFDAIYLGTAVAMDGALVWHLYDVTFEVDAP